MDEGVWAFVTPSPWCDTRPWITEGINGALFHPYALPILHTCGTESGHAGHSKSCAREQSFKSRKESRKTHLSFLGHFEVCEQAQQKVLSTVLSLLVFLEVNLLPVLKQVAAILILVQWNPGVRCPVFCRSFFTMAEYSIRNGTVSCNHSLRFFPAGL